MYDDDISRAIQASRLASLPGDVLTRLFTDAPSVEFPAGATIHRPATTHAALVVRGVVRVFMISEAGRQITVRYCRPGALLGIATLFSRPGHGVTDQALTVARVVVLRVGELQQLARTDVRVAHALLTEVSDRVTSYLETLGGTAFGTVREQVVRHLLDVAADHQHGGVLVARLSQQDLADHVGTVREVVVRILRELREQGLIRTGRDEIVLVDPAELHARTWTRVRGGGGNFGVVTSFEYDLHPVDTVVGGLVLHRADKAPEVLAFYADFCAAAPEELTTLAGFLHAPPEPFVPEDLRLRPALAIVVCYTGDLAEGAKVLEPLRRVGTPDADVIGPMPYVALQTMLDAAAPPGMRNYWKSGYLSGLDGAVIDALTVHAAQARSPLSAVHLHQLGGTVARGGSDTSAFGHRSAFAPDIWARLVQIQTAWDPDNVFRLNQNIRPAKAAVDATG